MIEEKVLSQFPMRRIQPFDGMSVTAEVWEEAHDYHRHLQRLHAVLSHGSGIVTGLEVVASDPPDDSVYIRPGIAIDPAGQTIVLQQPLSFDLGAAQGTLHLLLTYDESQPHTEERGQGNNIMYVQSQYGLEAAIELPDAPFVELARVRRTGRTAPIVVAADPALPKANEIDLRFREHLAPPRRLSAGIGVCHLGGKGNAAHSEGVHNLVQALARDNGTAPCTIWVDEIPALVPHLDLSSYALIYLVGLGAFHLSPDEMQVLYGYLQGSGTLLIESCRQGLDSAEAPADASFLDLLTSLGVKLEDLPVAAPGLLREPNLFGAPPAGFETEGEPKTRLGDGVIMSTADYGCLWQGLRRGRPATRDEIRSAMEWGANLVAHALERRNSQGHGLPFELRPSVSHPDARSL